jgi:repressor LexA
MGYLRRDPTKPRAIEVRFDPASGATGDRATVRHVPLLGEVAAGTGVIAQQSVEELMPVPAAFTGDGELFMLRVVGDSMIEAGIFTGDFVIVRRQNTAVDGEIVVAGINGEEATVKRFSQRDGVITLAPANSSMEPIVRKASEVELYGKVVTVMRKL